MLSADPLLDARIHTLRVTDCSESVISNFTAQSDTLKRIFVGTSSLQRPLVAKPYATDLTRSHISGSQY
jgi:hypothetical protein